MTAIVSLRGIAELDELTVDDDKPTWHFRLLNDQMPRIDFDLHLRAGTSRDLILTEASDVARHSGTTVMRETGTEVTFLPGGARFESPGSEDLFARESVWEE